MPHKEGFLMIDHRFSPGLTEAEALACGLPPKMAAEGKLLEAATLTCSHCKNAVMKNPLRSRERNFCHKCGFHYICDICAFKASLPDYDHTPFDKIIDHTLRAAALGCPPTLLLP